MSFRRLWLSLLLLIPDRPGLAATELAISWTDPDGTRGRLQAFDTRAPWAARTPALEIGADSVLRVGPGGHLLALGRAAGTLALIDPATWTLEREIALDPPTPAVDGVAIDDRTAYVIRDGGSHLLRVDLATGEVRDAVDLTQLELFQAGGGVPQLGRAILDGRHLIVQLGGRYDPYPGQLEPLSQLVVIDVDGETLVDVDPVARGIQAIELEGEPPDFEMEILPGTRQLLVSATGGLSNPFGGLELVDLDALASLGVVLTELDDVSAQIDGFALVTPEWGWLVFSTDIVLSSHLAPFSLTENPPPVPAGSPYETLFFLVPDIVYDPASDHLFWPEVDGFHVFAAHSGERLTAERIPFEGAPTDVLLLQRPDPVPVLPVGGKTALAAALMAAALLFSRLRARASRQARACAPAAGAEARPGRRGSGRRT